MGHGQCFENRKRHWTAFPDFLVSGVRKNCSGYGSSWCDLSNALTCSNQVPSNYMLLIAFNFLLQRVVQIRDLANLEGIKHNVLWTSCALYFRETMPSAYFKSKVLFSKRPENAFHKSYPMVYLKTNGYIEQPCSTMKRTEGKWNLLVARSLTLGIKEHLFTTYKRFRLPPSNK